MNLTTTELIAFNELKAKISDWFSTGTAVFNKDHLNAPADQFVVFAEIQLTEMGRVTREASLSSSMLRKLLSKDYAFIASVRIEPQIERILIRLCRGEQEELTTT